MKTVIVFTLATIAFVILATYCTPASAALVFLKGYTFGQNTVICTYEGGGQQYQRIYPFMRGCPLSLDL